MKKDYSFSVPLHVPKLQLPRLALTVLFASFAYAGFAQDEAPQHTTPTNIELDSELSGRGGGVIQESVSEAGAEWLRLNFDDVELGRNSTLTITSEEDGASQTFTAESIKEWSNGSAYFNGDRVNVTINVAEGDDGVRATVEELNVGESQGGIAEAQCGYQDDRVASNNPAVGRLGPSGCTGWIITNGRLVTAGHCSRLDVVMFNVPKSNSNRSLRFPAPRDQYPLTNINRGGDKIDGTDWAVLTAGRNTETGLTPIQAQNRSFNVVRRNPVSPIRITGFGSDTGVDNQTQQTHVGNLTSATNIRVNYATDTEGGNSGSPIIDATGNAVGVHTNGGCNTLGSNSGTRATVPAFWNAMGLNSNPNPPNPPKPPSGEAVTVYLDCRFAGASTGLPEGRYDVPALTGRGIPNDKISSIRVKAGFEAVLYWDGGFRGRTLVRGGDDDCLDNEGWNDKASSIVVRRTGGGGGGSARQIEAESFSSMKGIQTEPCSEGGLNVGYTDPGDFLAYNNVNFPTSGQYIIEYRVASAVGGGKFSTDLNAGGIVLGEINVPNTGGWQNWTTVRHTVNVNAGTYPLGIFVLNGGFNLNWLKISSASALQGRTDDEADAPSVVTLFPNPATSTITVQGLDAGASIQIYDMLGRSVLTTTEQEYIDVQQLSPGQYVVKATGQKPLSFIKK